MKALAPGSPSLHAEALADSKPVEADTAVGTAGALRPSPPTGRGGATAGGTVAELERLADDVLAIFEDSPERLEALVASLKRLEAGAKTLA